jgi:outer membrane protein assembly factor BamB
MSALAPSSDIACFLFFCCLVCPRSAKTRLCFGEKPQQSGVYDAAGLAEFNAMKWKFHARGMLIGSPAVMQGRIYSGTRVDSTIGICIRRRPLREACCMSDPPSGKLLAVDVSDFKPAWSFETEGTNNHGLAYTKSDLRWSPGTWSRWEAQMEICMR